MTVIAKLSSIRILVAHNHPALRLHLRADLNALGYEVIEAETCIQAINIMRARKVSAIVMDGDAPDFLSASPLSVRNSTINASTPSIVLTKARTISSINNSFNPELDDYLLKPFGIEVLARNIKGVLKKPNNKQKVSLGSTTICSQRGTITIDGLASKIPARQMQILMTLASHAPRAVGNELFARTLGLQGAPSNKIDATIKSLIFRLRKELRDSGSDVHIKTIRGYGYRAQAAQTEPSK